MARADAPNDLKLRDGCAGEGGGAAGVHTDGYLSEAMDRSDSEDFPAPAEDPGCAHRAKDARRTSAGEADRYGDDSATTC